MTTKYNCLVTGGAGFIGSNLVDELIKQGHNVTIIDDFSTGNLDNLNPKAKFIQTDIRDNLENVFEDKFDYVFHLAAQINLRKSIDDPQNDYSINVLGSRNLFQESEKNKVKKIIFSSTGGAIYSPDAKIPCNEESEINPLSPYGQHKEVAEAILKNSNLSKKVVLRYSNVYGPRQDSKGEAGVVSIFANNVLNDLPLNVFGNGEQTRDFVYVKDVVSANIRAMEEDMSGTYNVSSGVETSLNNLISQFKKENLEINYLPAIEGELKRNCLDSSKLQKTGWNPKYSLEEGLQETIQWYENNLS